MPTLPRRTTLGLLASLLGPLAWGQSTVWPERPVRMVVPYTPGGGTDAVTRHLGDRLTQDAKWTLLIDNKPGGGGNIGLDLVAKAKPDGYTLGMGQTANLAINPAAMSRMPFDPARDLVPVALVAELPVVLVVHPDAPWKRLSEFVVAAKAKPQQLKQALAGTGTVGHLAGEMLSRRAGFQVLDVPYKGAAPALTDLLGRQTDFMFATPQAVLGMVKAGKLRALAVTSEKRMPVLPDVPTVAESGYKDFEAVDWKMVVAPAGTSPELVRTIHAAVDKAVRHPAFTAQLEAEGSAPLHGTPEQVLTYLRREQGEWGALIREARIRFD